MSADRRVVHGSLTQTLRLDVPARAVFVAFSDRSLRVRWFRIPAELGTARHELDFRPGSHELLVGTVAVAGVRERIEYRSRFVDVIDARRVVFTTELLVDDRLRSVSLVSWLLPAAPRSCGKASARPTTAPMGRRWRWAWRRRSACATTSRAR